MGLWNHVTQPGEGLCHCQAADGGSQMDWAPGLLARHMSPADALHHYCTGAAYSAMTAVVSRLLCIGCKQLTGIEASLNPFMPVFRV